MLVLNVRIRNLSPHSGSGSGVHCLRWAFLHAFAHLLILFKSKTTFFLSKLKFFSEKPSACQKVWIQVRTDLIWVQTVYKDYQQRTLVGKEIKKNQFLNLHKETLPCAFKSDNARKRSLMPVHDF